VEKVEVEPVDWVEEEAAGTAAEVAALVPPTGPDVEMAKVEPDVEEEEPAVTATEWQHRHPQVSQMRGWRRSNQRWIQRVDSVAEEGAEATCQREEEDIETAEAVPLQLLLLAQLRHLLMSQFVADRARVWGAQWRAGVGREGLQSRAKRAVASAAAPWIAVASCSFW
jgi:hypothetical protein